MTDDLQARDRVQVATPQELAEAREARGMSQVDISQRIKLQVKQVKALEQGEWDALPGRSFVRGALRSYGKLIDVDVSPLLESIGGFAEPTQVEGITPLDAPITRSSGLGFNGGGRGSPILWVIAGLIGVVALVLYFGSDRDRSGVGSWLRPGTEAPASGGDSASPQSPAAPAGGMAAPAPGPGESPADGSAPGSGSSAAPVPSGAPSSSLEPSSASSAHGSNDSPAQASTPPLAAAADGTGTASVDPASSAPAAAPMLPGATPPGPSSQSEPGAAPAASNGGATPPPASLGNEVPVGRADGAVATSEVAPLASARMNATEATADGSAAEAPTVVDTKGLIRIEAGSKDAWIEVRQADGTALHNGLVKAGESVELRGTPPYRLVLGNASHVTLAYEGKPRDLGPHMRSNNIARLQLR